MRRAGAPEESLLRNVSEAFDSCMRRLDELYKARRGHVPSDFFERINFWATECALPPEVHERMHTLRIWRNAASI